MCMGGGSVRVASGGIVSVYIRHNKIMCVCMVAIIASSASEQKMFCHALSISTKKDIIILMRLYGIDGNWSG